MFNKNNIYCYSLTVKLQIHTFYYQADFKYIYNWATWSLTLLRQSDKTEFIRAELSININGDSDYIMSKL